MTAEKTAPLGIDYAALPPEAQIVHDYLEASWCPIRSAPPPMWPKGW
ncbi:hypothetical protein [Alloyangia mangrovi]|nr:hypothetical protein [Alloyangia mangrovi]